MFGRRFGVDTAITAKFAAKVRLVPPANDNTELQWTPVEFTGLTALPWIDDSGMRPRIAWSFGGEEMVKPGQVVKPGQATEPKPE